MIKISGYYKSQIIKTEHLDSWDAEVKQVFQKCHIRILRNMGISTN